MTLRDSVIAEQQSEQKMESNVMSHEREARDGDEREERVEIEERDGAGVVERPSEREAEGAKKFSVFTIPGRWRTKIEGNKNKMKFFFLCSKEGFHNVPGSQS